MSSREFRAAIRQAKAEAAQEAEKVRRDFFKLQAEHDKARAAAAEEISALHTELQAKERERGGFFTERVRLFGEIKTVKKERDAARAEEHEQRLWRVDLQGEVDTRVKERDAARAELAAARASYTEEFATYQGHMQKELAKALENDNAADMKKELAAANRQTKKANAAYENCAKDRERYRTERDDAQKKLEDARAVKKQAKARLTKLQTTAKALQADIVRKDEAMASLKKGHDVLKKENRQLAAQVRKRKRDDDSMTPQRLLETALKKMKQTHTDWYTNVPREFDDPMYILKWKQYGMKWRKERGSGRMQYSAALKDAAGHPPLWNNVAEAKRAVAKMEQRAASSKN